MCKFIEDFRDFAKDAEDPRLDAVYRETMIKKLYITNNFFKLFGSIEKSQLSNIYDKIKKNPKYFKQLIEREQEHDMSFDYRIGHFDDDYIGDYIGDGDGDSECEKKYDSGLDSDDSESFDTDVNNLFDESLKNIEIYKKYVIKN